MVFYAAYPVKGTLAPVKFPYKIGIVAFMAYPKLLKSDEGAGDALRWLAEDPFFELLELPPVGDAEWAKLRSYPKEYSLGLQPETLVRGLDPSSPNEEERRRAEERFVELTRSACSRGYKAVGLCSGPNLPEDQRPRGVEALKKTLRAVAEEAGKCGIPVFLETFDTDVDKKRLVGKLDMASRIIEEVRETHPNVAIMWDLSHGPLLGEEPEVLRSYPDVIGHIHIGAAKVIEGKMFDYHPGFYRPGAINNERDVARLLAVLHDIGYRGAISFEVKPEEGQDVREVLGASKEALERAYRMLVEGRV